MAGHRGAKRPSIFEVAKLAGVSHQTVSRVINHSPNVAEATRAKVEHAIAELGYHPSNLGQVRAVFCLFSRKASFRVKRAFYANREGRFARGKSCGAGFRQAVCGDNL